ncbi:MAG: hypothetical protein M1827_000605 [Pycnora praestabilis]|nr:MAG: hypothetical protein M1827_000605 [Pycnora praestabilis]
MEGLASIERVIVGGVGAFAVVITFTSTVMTTILAVSLTIAHLPVCIPALAAVVLSSLAFGLLAVFTLQYWRQWKIEDLDKRRRRIWSILMLGALPSLLAAVVTAATFGWMSLRFVELPERVVGRPKHQIFLPSCIIWGTAVLAQCLFYTFSLWSLRQREAQPVPVPCEDPEHGSEMQETTRPNTSHTAHSRPSQEQSLPSPTHSATPSETISSIRSSLSQVVRPVTSRTKLLVRQTSFPRYSKHSSSDSAYRDREREQDGFDTWDTSSVGPQVRQAVLQSSPPPTRGGVLEPIPGSRSPSPGLALEGPFPLLSPTVSPSSHPRPPKRRSQSFNEDHIHPLFRTDSPTPPPTATPGTNVTAAPLGGRVLFGSRRAITRTRSESLPSSPSPLVHSHSSDPSTIRRSVTPPSREMTPPIPDFILSAGSRSSLVGYGKRKASLRIAGEEGEDQSPTGNS